MGLTLMAHQTSGAPPFDVPLELKLLMAHLAHGAPLVLKKIFELVRMSKHTNGASIGSAPLLVVTSNGAPVGKCATNVVFLLYFYSFFAKLLMAHCSTVRQCAITSLN